MSLETRIDYRSFHIRQERMPQIMIPTENISQEQMIVGGVDGYIHINPSFDRPRNEKNVPRNQVSPPEWEAPLSKKGDIFTQKETMAAD